MTAPASTVKQDLHEKIDAMDERTAVRALAMISLWEDDGDFTPEEEAELLKAIEAADEDLRLGRTISGEDFEREIGFER